MVGGGKDREEMRLIDADALCEKIRKIYDGYMLDEGCTPIDFENMVDEQPTAFDTEKVVEQLESLSNAEADYYYAKSNDVIDRENAIDIVKKGGVK